MFCGPSMVFTNVYNPRSAVVRKSEYRKTLVRHGATLGANCTVVCGITIGRHAFVGAGAVVNRSVPRFRAGGRRAGAPDRLDEPIRPPAGPAAAWAMHGHDCEDTGEVYLLRDGACVARRGAAVSAAVRTVSIVGARPQFVKVSPVSRAMKSSPMCIEDRIVHTGQHYDDSMSQIFFEELEIPRPDANLGIGSGPQGCQTGRMLEAIEAYLQRRSPGCRDRVRRYELDSCGCSRRRQDAYSGGARGGGAAQLQPQDAGGAQSDSHRPSVRDAVRADGDCDAQSGDRRARGPVGR